MLWEALYGGFSHLPWALPCAGWLFQVPELGGMFSTDAMGLRCPGPVRVLFSPRGFSSLNPGKRKSTPRFPDLYHPDPLTCFQASAPTFQEPAGCPLLQLQSFHPPCISPTSCRLLSPNHNPDHISYLFTNVLQLPIPYQWRLHTSVPVHLAGANSPHPLTPPLRPP